MSQKKYKISISAKVLSNIDRIKRENNIPKEYGFRIAIKNRGCSGFDYSIGFDPKSNNNDYVIEMKSIKIFIDEKSLLLLEGTKIDFKNSRDEQGFIFENPNVKTACGCGNSL